MMGMYNFVRVDSVYFYHCKYILNGVFFNVVYPYIFEVSNKKANQ